MLPVRHRKTGQFERGFSLVESIVALSMLTIVLGGSAMAISSADNTENTAKAVADIHSVGEKGVERLRNDLSAQAWCDTQAHWIDTAAAAKSAPTAAEVNFAECPIQYNDMRDAKGRLYQVAIVVDAKDRPDDGYGSEDNDGDLRDAYEVETTVQLSPDSRAGRESVRTDAITLGGTIDWEGGSSDKAQITVVGCAIDRPDRALVAGGCAVGDASRQPLTVTVNVDRVGEEAHSLSSAGTITSGGTPGLVPPGAYEFRAPNSITPASGGTFTLLKLDPSKLRVYGSQNYTVQATYVRSDMPTYVCTQIVTWDTQPRDDGYEILETNIHWRRTNQPGYRSMRLTMNGDSDDAPGVQTQLPHPSGNRWLSDENRSWNCGHVMMDPIKAAEGCPENTYLAANALCPSLYRGLYDIEVEQVGAFGFLRWFQPIVNQYRLTVADASMNCNTLSAWNQPMGGTPLIGRGEDPVNERDSTSNRTSWYARMAITASSGAQSLCLRFHTKNYERIRCYDHDTNPGAFEWEGPDAGAAHLDGCFNAGPQCRLELPAGAVDNDNNCWNGADICATCGSGGVQGTAGAYNHSFLTGGVSGGPNDGTVACDTTDSYSWPGASHHNGWGYTPLIDAATRNSYTWIGGSDAYYASYSGRVAAYGGHPWGVDPDYATYNLMDHQPYYCTMSYFTAGSALFTHFGGPYRFYECLQVRVNGRTMRGRLLDVSGSGSTFYGTVGTAMKLAPDASILQTYWNPFGGGAGTYQMSTNGGPGWPTYEVSKVDGDPNCGAPVVHIDPIIWDLWEKVVNEQHSYPLPAPPNTTNLTTDEVGV